MQPSALAAEKVGLDNIRAHVHCRCESKQKFAVGVAPAMSFSGEISVLHRVAVDAAVRAGVVVGDVGRAEADATVYRFPSVDGDGADRRGLSLVPPPPSVPSALRTRRSKFGRPGSSRRQRRRRMTGR